MFSKIFKKTPPVVIAESSNNEPLPNQAPEIPLLFPIGHFYSPIVDPKDIRSRENQIWNKSDVVAGVDLNIEQQIDLLTNLKQFPPDIQWPVEQPTEETKYFYSNDQYPILDAEFLYSMIRFAKPKNIIEIGSGFSSLITAEVNKDFFQESINFLCIEPYPRQFLLNGVRGITKLIQEKVENVELSFFSILNAGDILFIDSSHVSKAGSDVNYLFFEILPTIKPGVLVHIHDIFLPDEYPKEWVIDQGRNWNEQYLLRAFLQFNKDWEVVWSGYLMGTRYTTQVQSTFPNYPKLGGGGSFWIRRIR